MYVDDSFYALIGFLEYLTADGIIRYLPDKERRRFWNVYGLITHYQEEVEILHRAKIQGEDDKLAPEFYKHLENLRNEIRKRMKTIFDEHPPDSEFDLSVYEHPPEFSITLPEHDVEDSDL